MRSVQRIHCAQYLFLVIAGAAVLPNRIMAQDSIDTRIPRNITALYADLHVLVGAEILDPLHPSGFFSRAANLWKTDVRIGLTHRFTSDVMGFVAVRDNDSPGTNDIRLYEAGGRIRTSSMTFWFGQRRLQAGVDSRYLRGNFDRPFWDKGIIYDFHLRGTGADVDVPGGMIDLFLGSEVSASFIGGADYRINPFNGWQTSLHAVYTARDPEYSAFGGQFGAEFRQRYGPFSGCEIVGYKVYEQDPADFRVLVIFGEGRWQITERMEAGAAAFLHRLEGLGPNRDELRGSVDFGMEWTETLRPVFQVEYFDVAGYHETQIGALMEIIPVREMRIIPKLRYIVTELGPDIAFFGIEGHLHFGDDIP